MRKENLEHLVNFFTFILIIALFYAVHNLRDSCSFWGAAHISGMVGKKIVILKPWLFWIVVYFETSIQSMTNLQ